jgi:hypothetical protein
MVYLSLMEREMKGARKERVTKDKLIIFISHAPTINEGDTTDNKRDSG